MAFTEIWKRRQAELQYDWDVADFEIEEVMPRRDLRVHLATPANIIRTIACALSRFILRPENDTFQAVKSLHFGKCFSFRKLSIEDEKQHVLAVITCVIG